MKARNLEKKIGRDRDSDVKKGGIARLRGKIKREGGILSPIVDPIKSEQPGKKKLKAISTVASEKKKEL